MNKISKQNIGNAGEYFIAYILSKEGFVVTITLGRNIGYDIIAINPKNKTVKIQVKTTQRENAKDFPMTEKHENLIEDNLFYAFVRLKDYNSVPDFWILPSKLVANVIKRSHEIWMETPAKNGGKHSKTSIRAFILKGKFSPVGWEEELKKYKSNIEILKN